MVSELEYIERVRRGDDDAFAVLYGQCRESFFGYFRSAYRKRAEYIENLYQDACVVVWQQILSGRYVAKEQNSGAQLCTYIIGVARHLMFSRDRQARKMQSMPDLSALEQMLHRDAVDDSVRQDEICALDALVSNMKEPCNSLLFMYYWARMRGDEIALALGYRDADSVKTQKYKCMRKLKLAVLKIIR